MAMVFVCVASTTSFSVRTFAGAAQRARIMQLIRRKIISVRLPVYIESPAQQTLKGIVAKLESDQA